MDEVFARLTEHLLKGGVLKDVPSVKFYENPI